MSTLQSLKAAANDEIDKKSRSLYELSMKIWNKPELCYEETFAHKTLTDFLESEGFCVERHTPLETSFIARFGTSDGPQIGIMCEYDALPGIGHACGHNLIAEAGVAAALGIKAVLATNSDLKGRVIVYGTPAEEGGGGKVVMIEKGSFDDSDLCMMVHPFAFDVDNEDYHVAAIDQMEIVYRGKASHASAAPWEGLNALDAAVSCYNNISMMRQQMKPDCRVHGVITNGGEKPNIIPRQTVLFYYIRAPTDKERDALKQRVIACAKGAAEATGCSVEFIAKERPYSNLRSNKALRRLYEHNLMATGYKPSRMSVKFSMAGSTDAGNVSHVKPTIHPSFAIPGQFACHTEQFAKVAGTEAAQAPTLRAGKVMAMTGVEVIFDPSKCEEIKHEFQTRDNSA